MRRLNQMHVSLQMQAQIEAMYFGEQKHTLQEIGDAVGCTRQNVHAYLTNNYGKSPKEAQRARYLEVQKAKAALEQQSTEGIDLEQFEPMDDKDYVGNQSPRNHLYSKLRKLRILEEYFRHDEPIEKIAKKHKIHPIYVQIIIKQAASQAQANLG